MSIRSFVWLAAFSVVVGLAGTASAQRFQPFIDPGYFEPDFQFFAPAEVGDFGDGEPPNTGVYFDYDRTYVNVTRPDGEPSLFSGTYGDFTWGNRWEIGYMTDDHTGWQAVLWHLSGPNEYLNDFQERINRINEDDIPVNDTPDPIIQDRNPRVYNVRQSLQCGIDVLLRIQQNLAAEAVSQRVGSGTAGRLPIHEFSQFPAP